MRNLIDKKNGFLPKCISLLFCLLLLFSVLANSLMVLLQLCFLAFAGISVIMVLDRKQSIRLNYGFFCGIYILFLIFFHMDMRYKGVTVMAIAPWSFLLLPNVMRMKKKNILFMVFSIGFAGILLGFLILLKHDFSDKMRIGLLGAIAVNSNIVSYTVGLGSLVFLYLAIFHAKRRKWIYFACAMLALLVVYVCQSRGALLATVIGELALLYYACKKKARYFSVYRGILILFVLMLPLFIFVYSLRNGMSFFDNNGRTELWRAAIDVWQRNPIFGSGVFIQLGEHPSSHNLIFDVLMQSGIIGLILMGGIWITVFRQTKKEGRAFFCFAFLQAMIDTRQYYMLAIALLLGLFITYLQQDMQIKELKK